MQITVWQFTIMNVFPARKTSASWFSCLCTGVLYHLACPRASCLTSSLAKTSVWQRSYAVRCCVLFISSVRSKVSEHTWNNSRFLCAGSWIGLLCLWLPGQWSLPVLGNYWWVGKKACILKPIVTFQNVLLSSVCTCMIFLCLMSRINIVIGTATNRYFDNASSI